jgi:ribosomal protein L11 methyltransferase
VNRGDEIKDLKLMPEAPRSSATVVARLSSDAATAQNIADALADSLAADEFAASAFEDASGRWSLAIYFREPPNAAAVRALIASLAGAAAAQALCFETLAPADWVRNSLEGLAPVEAGRFVVHGAHARARVRENRIGIQVEAGLAFGTGHHGTTRGCLLALDRIVQARSRRPAARRPAASRPAARSAAALPRKRERHALALDVGTGTGVLAIAAVKALRQRVLASDLDARAVAIARENARINRVGGALEVIHAGGLRAAAFRARGPYALIFANILLDPLKALATPMARLVAANGHVVLSGLLAGQAGAALASYRARGLVLVRRMMLENWATLILVRPRTRRAERCHRAAG